MAHGSKLPTALGGCEDVATLNQEDPEEHRPADPNPIWNATKLKVKIKLRKDNRYYSKYKVERGMVQWE